MARTSPLRLRLAKRIIGKLRSLRRRLPAKREEAAAYLAPFRGRQLPPVRIVLFAQGRTGSTLFGELIGGHPDVCWLAEILGRRVRWPLRWVEGHARLSGGDAVGFQVKIYQLTHIQLIRDPGAFLRGLHGSGWSVLYLWRRNLVRQALSNFAAKQRGSFHERGGPASLVPVRVDTVRLLRECRWRDYQYQRELEVLRDIPHESFCYESDLLDNSRWQESADRAFAHVRLRSHPVTTTLRRLSTDTSRS